MRNTFIILIIHWNLIIYKTATLGFQVSKHIEFLAHKRLCFNPFKLRSQQKGRTA